MRKVAIILVVIFGMISTTYANDLFFIGGDPYDYSILSQKEFIRKNKEQAIEQAVKKISEQDRLERQAMLNKEWEEGAVRVPYFSQTRNYYAEAEAWYNVPYLNSQIFKLAIKYMYVNTTLGAISRISKVNESANLFDKSGSPIENPEITPQEANEKFGQYGIEYYQNMPKNQAEQLAAMKIEEASLREQLSHRQNTFGGSLALVLGLLIGAMLDPINIVVLLAIVFHLQENRKSLIKKVLWSANVSLILNILAEVVALIAAEKDYRVYTGGDIFVGLLAGALFGILVCLTIEGFKYLNKIANMTEEDKEQEKQAKEQQNRKLEESKIRNITNKMKTAKDFEIADLVYRLMIYRDNNYSANEVQAFIFPQENLELIKSSIMPKLKTSSKILHFVKSKDSIIPMIWLNTFYYYLEGQNKDLISELWMNLDKGFELSKNKYLQKTANKYNFDNSNFYKRPQNL